MTSPSNMARLTVSAVTDKVTVTITENSGTELYDGTEKKVTGYDGLRSAILCTPKPTSVSAATRA